VLWKVSLQEIPPSWYSPFDCLPTSSFGSGVGCCLSPCATGCSGQRSCGGCSAAKSGDLLLAMGGLGAIAWKTQGPAEGVGHMSVELCGAGEGHTNLLCVDTVICLSERWEVLRWLLTKSWEEIEAVERLYRRMRMADSSRPPAFKEFVAATATQPRSAFAPFASGHMNGLVG
jgi:hypothetical protein